MIRAVILAAVLAGAGAARAQVEPATAPMLPAQPGAAKAGDPADHLPPGTRLISSFGERPVFSPDGRRLAFIGASYGDAFEYEIATGRTRNLTAHAPHQGFLRVHYLPDGSYLLLGPHQHGRTREETRLGRIELWWMDAEAARPPVRLKVHVHEGIAVSRERNRVAWTAPMPRGVARAADIRGATLHTADLIVSGGTARLENVREIAGSFGADCVVEAQDFLPGDGGITLPCYHWSTPITGAGVAPKPMNPTTDVLSIDVATRRITTYPTPRDLYGEVEGLFPDGRHTLVECTSDRTAGMEICALEMKTERPRYVRLTRIMDWGRWKYGNPVVSGDGRTIAAQIGPADVIDAGVGEGIVLIDLPTGF